MTRLSAFKNFFRRKPSEPYELVETKVGDSFRQGVRLNAPEKFSGLIVTFSPRVHFSERDDSAVLHFDYRVEKNPNNIDLIDRELRPILGDIILDLIKKDLF